jgi:hypothetical protein
MGEVKGEVSVSVEELVSPSRWSIHDTMRVLHFESYLIGRLYRILQRGLCPKLHRRAVRRKPTNLRSPPATTSRPVAASRAPWRRLDDVHCLVLRVQLGTHNGWSDTGTQVSPRNTF